MDPKARKAALRQVVIARILALDPEDRRSQEARLIRRFPEIPGLAQSQRILLYVSAFPEEFDTRRLLSAVLGLGKTLILPRVDRPSRTLHLFEVTDLARDVEPGHRGILEPSLACPRVEPGDVDWVLVPGLAFNSQGYRLGRGAGHYDKLLAVLRPEVPRWSLIFDAQWVEDLPIEPHDQPLDGVADHRRVLERLR